MWQNEQNSWAEQSIMKKYERKTCLLGDMNYEKWSIFSRYSINIPHMVTQVWQRQINDSVINSAMICVNKKKFNLTRV